MSFGYSVGDFIAGANLTYRLIRVLSETKGACLEYQEAMMELGAMQQAFLQVSHMKHSDMLPRATTNSASHIVMSAMDIIANFLERSKEYQKRLRDSDSGAGIGGSWCKIGWTLFKKEELRSLRDSLQCRLAAITTLLTAASYSYTVPEGLAKFQIGPSAEEQEEFENLRLGHGDTKSLNHKGSLSHSSSDLHSQGSAKESWSLAGTARDSMTSITQSGVSPVADKMISTLGSSQTLAQKSGRQASYELPVDKTRSAEQESSRSDKEMDSNHDGTDQASESVCNHDEMHTALKSESIYTLSDLPTEDKPSKIQCQGADTTFLSPRTVRELRSFLMSTEKRGNQEPIAFKDAVGRKFSFPFEACRTWNGIEELVKQAFLHVDILGPHVAEGHYDLIGQDGTIILPQIWESVIRPGWSITMHMWPMPEKKLRPRNFPPPPPPPPPLWPVIGQPEHGSKKADAPGRPQPPTMAPLVMSKPENKLPRNLPKLKTKKRRWWPWKPNDTCSISSCSTC